MVNFGGLDTIKALTVRKFHPHTEPFNSCPEYLSIDPGSGRPLKIVLSLHIDLHSLALGGSDGVQNTFTCSKMEARGWERQSLNF